MKRRPCLILGLLLALVAWTFWPAIRGNFINYDDPDYVTGNAHVQGGLTAANFAWAFRSTEAANWHPATWLSHMLDAQIFGLRPWGHHLANLLLHEANTLLVFLWLQRLMGATWRSLFVAGLFALHPLHVESVAWVSERKDVLSGLFFLLTLLAYTRYVEKPAVHRPPSIVSKSKVQSPKSKATASNITTHKSRFTFHVSRFTSKPSLYYILALISFALGLMSKPMLVTLPFVLLLLDYWPLGRIQLSTSNFRLSTLLEKIPFFLLSALASLITFQVQHGAGAVQTSVGLPFLQRLDNALVAYGRYLGKLFYPANLAVFYPHPVHWPPGTVWLAVTIVVGISILMLAWHKRHPYGLVGWFWFLGMLVPVLGFVQVGAQSMADRYAYLPLLGPFIVLSWGIVDLVNFLATERLFARRHQRSADFQSAVSPISNRQAAPKPSDTVPNARLADGNPAIQQIGDLRYQGHSVRSKRLLSVAATATLLLCAGLAWRQAGYWHDSGTLFRHALAVTEANAVSYLQLGSDTLLQRGRLDEAIEQLEEAVRLKPNYAQAHNALGTAFEKKDRLEEAISQFDQAVKLYPGYVEARSNLGAALCLVGRTEEGRTQLEELIRQKPDYAPAHNHLGSALQAQGRLDQALSEFEAALRLNPSYPEAHNNLGIALGTKGQTDEAIAQFEAAIRLKPGYTSAYNNLGRALWSTGRRDEALRCFEAAVRRDPNSARAHGNFGVALAASGRRDEALHHLTEALRLQPNYPEAQQQLLKLQAK